MITFKTRWFFTYFSTKRYPNKEWLAIFIVAGLVFYFHALFIVNHFNQGGYLLDSGWFAYLFESEHISLKNPSVINNTSFYSVHFSPYLFFFGFPLHHLFKLSGINIFAIHQGFFFALFFYAVSTILFSTYKHNSHFNWVGCLSLGAFSNILLQAALYPHYEISILAVATSAIAAALLKKERLFYFLLFTLFLLREDGGMFATLIFLLIASTEKKINTNTLYSLAIFIGGTVCIILFKSYFWGFGALSNFSGNHWHHLSLQLFLNRTLYLLRFKFLVFIVGSIFLSRKDMRYSFCFILLLPLFTIYLLAARDELGRFSLYYGLPWLLIPVSWLYTYSQRVSENKNTSYDKKIIIFFLLFSAIGPGLHHFYISIKSLSWQKSTQEIAFTKEKISGFINAEKNEKHCFSVGLAALIPNQIKNGEYITPESNITTCRFIYLFKNDMDYLKIKKQVNIKGYSTFLKVGKIEAMQYTS